MKTIQGVVCGAIPPHMMKEVASHGDDETRDIMASTLQHTALIAERRLVAPPTGPDNAPGRKKILVYNGRHRQKLPGTLAISTARPGRSTDRSVREAFEGAVRIWDFLRRVFNRESIDDRGMPIVSTVHYSQGFDNAMWDGRQMIYGDGDGVYFNRFTVDLDIMGHEMAHGVTQSTSELDYQGQTGALNEHFSDALGMTIKQYTLNQRADESSWIIGESIFTSRVHGQGIRSMKAPGTAYDDPVLGRDPQPAHMRDYVITSEDNGGVHINSGIANHAYYLASVDIGDNT